MSMDSPKLVDISRYPFDYTDPENQLNRSAAEVCSLVKIAIQQLASEEENNNSNQKKIEPSQFGNFFTEKTQSRTNLETLGIITKFSRWILNYEDIIGKNHEQEDIENLEKLHKRTKKIIKECVVNEDDHPLQKTLCSVMSRMSVNFSTLLLNKIATKVYDLVKVVFQGLNMSHEDKINPHHKKVHERSIDWIKTYKIFEDPKKIAKIDASKFGEFIGKAHPNADLETLSIISDFATWLFIYDDMIERCRDKQVVQKLHERTITIIKNCEEKDGDIPLQKGLCSIMQRMYKIYNSPFWKQKFVHDVQDYLIDGTLWEMDNRKDESVPSLTEYQRKRPNTSATKVMFNFIEDGFDIPENDFIKQIRLLGANLVNWENDLRSAPKEIISQDLHNLVFVYRKQNKCSYADAVQLSARDLKDDWAKFQTLAENIPDFGVDTQNIAKYIQGVKDWVDGHSLWANVSPRYNPPFLTPR